MQLPRSNDKTTPKWFNIKIEELPDDVNRVLNMLGIKRAVRKPVLIREALIEYAHKHEAELRGGRVK